MSHPPDQSDNWLCVLFSILSGALTQSDKDRLANVKASWVLLNTRLGRFFVDILAPIPQLQAIRDELAAMGRDPIVIGVFDRNGVLQSAPNTVEWLKVAPDVIVRDASGNVTSTTRPTSFINCHSWAGWDDKVVP